MTDPSGLTSNIIAKQAPGQRLHGRFKYFDPLYILWAAMIGLLLFLVVSPMVRLVMVSILRYSAPSSVSRWPGRYHVRTCRAKN